MSAGMPSGIGSYDGDGVSPPFRFSLSGLACADADHHSIDHTTGIVDLIGRPNSGGRRAESVEGDEMQRVNSPLLSAPEGLGSSG